jgi:hypothetical protein
MVRYSFNLLLLLAHLLAGWIDEIDANSVLSPFLTMLRTPQLSGPFITLSLDAIHTFVSCNIIIKGTHGVSDTLGDVIDAVSRSPSLPLPSIFSKSRAHSITCLDVVLFKLMQSAINLFN